MITVTLTTVQGTEKKMSFDQLAQVRTFVDDLPKRLNKSTRVRVDCDLLGLNGWVQGTQSIKLRWCIQFAQ